MNNTVSMLIDTAKELNTTPQEIIGKSGYSKNNWYNWKDGKNKPSSDAAKKIMQTIERERQAKGISRPLPESLAQANAQPLRKEQIASELELRKAELEKTQKVVSALELLLSAV